MKTAIIFLSMTSLALVALLSYATYELQALSKLNNQYFDTIFNQSQIIRMYSLGKEEQAEKLIEELPIEQQAIINEALYRS